MRTVILDPASAGLEDVVDRRRRSGLDRLDEVWQGELHMIPAPRFEHAELATQLERLLGPLADQAGLAIAMHEFNLGESERDFRVPTVVSSAAVREGYGCLPRRWWWRSSRRATRPGPSSTSTPLMMSTRY